MQGGVIGSLVTRPCAPLSMRQKRSITAACTGCWLVREVCVGERGLLALSWVCGGSQQASLHTSERRSPIAPLLPMLLASRPHIRRFVLQRACFAPRHVELVRPMRALAVPAAPPLRQGQLSPRRVAASALALGIGIGVAPSAVRRILSAPAPAHCESAIQVLRPEKSVHSISHMCERDGKLRTLARLLWRCFELFCRLTPVLVTLPLLRTRLRASWLRLLVSTLGHCGPVGIKWGQVCAPTLFAQWPVGRWRRPNRPRMTHARQWRWVLDCGAPGTAMRAVLGASFGRGARRLAAFSLRSGSLLPPLWQPFPSALLLFVCGPHAVRRRQAKPLVCTCVIAPDLRMCVARVPCASALRVCLARLCLVRLPRASVSRASASRVCVSCVVLARPSCARGVCGSGRRRGMTSSKMISATPSRLSSTRRRSTRSSGLGASFARSWAGAWRSCLKGSRRSPWRAARLDRCRVQRRR